MPIKQLSTARRTEIIVWHTVSLFHEVNNPKMEQINRHDKTKEMCFNVSKLFQRGGLIYCL